MNEVLCHSVVLDDIFNAKVWSEGIELLTTLLLNLCTYALVHNCCRRIAEVEYQAAFEHEKVTIKQLHLF